MAQCLAAGASPAGLQSTGAQMDTIVEVDTGGKVVWEWCFFDHLVQDVDPTRPNYVGAGKTIADYPGRLNINLPGKPPRADSVQGEFYVIDHGGTFIAGSPTASIAQAAGLAGDFLYRFGDPARYAQGDPPAILEDWTQSTNGHKQLGAAHDVQWIGSGLTGAGHFLIFDNAQYLSEHMQDRTAVPCVHAMESAVLPDGTRHATYFSLARAYAGLHMHYPEIIARLQTIDRCNPIRDPKDIEKAAGYGARHPSYPPCESVLRRYGQKSACKLADPQ